MSDIKKVYGIDLGTTYSCISYMDEHNKAVVLSNSEGERITPSVVYFEDIGEDKPNVVVGTAAKESSKLYPNDVVSFIKRQMGTDIPFYHGDENYRPEEVSAYVLRKLVQDAAESTGEDIEDVVITVPAYFGVNEREATKRAGEIAGLNVIGLIPEPTAAAVAYGMTKEDDKKVLVYDLGGGTFDVTLIDISQESIEVVVTGGDHNLGGKDWDDAIISYLVDQYKEQTGSDEDILEDEETAQQLQLSAESAKKTLSSRNKAPIRFNHGAESVRVELTREKFEEITEHLLQRTIELTNLMLEEAKKKGEGADQVDEIILVGGSTRMPQIEARLTQEFNVQLTVFDPDESVAKGAALYGMQRSLQDWVKTRAQEINESTGGGSSEDTAKAEEQAIDELANIAPAIGPGSIESNIKRAIKNVTSKSFGIIAIVDGERKVVNLVKKNDSLPSVITQSFGTLEADQETALLEVMENELSDENVEIDNAVNIGEAVLELPHGLPEGAPISVKFVLNEDGRLEVTGVELTNNGQVNATLETSSIITLEEVEEAKVRSSALQIS
ncbi:Hsp70 family protein [Pontibacillus sp. ALD_SL1]|uniref:Hsp70 family protein n=1 Tax=Pontibacillus sp. ALD_SL1 TaxID=2777185 RepID=UPI001A9757AE|nr:Hsp70 family protein [Pontibacillus sp. ALD_SL1]